MPGVITTIDVVGRYLCYKRDHGITARTQWIIGRAMLPVVRALRDATGAYIYFDVITPRAFHHTLMGMAFELSDDDPDALYLIEV